MCIAAYVALVGKDRVEAATLPSSCSLDWLALYLSALPSTLCRLVLTHGADAFRKACLAVAHLGVSGQLSARTGLRFSAAHPKDASTQEVIGGVSLGSTSSLLRWAFQRVVARVSAL